MTSYQHILLCADLVKVNGDKVSERAWEISQATGAKISLIHVVEYPFTYGLPYEGPIFVEWLTELEKTAKENFKVLAERLKIPEERRYMPNGAAKHLIVETAEKIKADLIILGSHGRHGLSLVLLGSTANAVLHNAKCDVLAVRVNS